MGGMSKKYYLKLYKSTEKMIASDGQIITMVMPLLTVLVLWKI